MTKSKRLGSGSHKKGKHYTAAELESRTPVFEVEQDLPRKERASKQWDWTEDQDLVDVDFDRNLKLSICFAYQRRGCPASAQWDGRSGNVALIRRDLQYVAVLTQKMVKSTLEAFCLYGERGESYIGQQKPGAGGHNVLLPNDSEDTNFVCNLLEQGHSIRTAAYFLNSVRVKRGIVKASGCLY